MSYQTSSRSLQLLPPASCNKLDVDTHHFLRNRKEQGKAVTNSSSTMEHSESFSSVDAIEAVIRGLRSSDRLFCEPAGTSSIVKAELEAAAPLLLFEGSVAVAVDSEDPYWDFRASMEEMVMAHGDADDWGWLEGMLEWYLRANGEGSHGIIVEAFVDLLLMLASSPLLFSSTSTSISSCSVQKKTRMMKKKKNGSCS